MKKGMGAFEVIVYVLIVIVIFILVAYFVIPNFKSLSEGFFNALGSFK